ncbi:MAG: uroporphyrinogen decarboxylase family protein [Dehalococcoidia bacterium]|nr:uroporphyrinogen decarboxylase family protein [Dehalococcoidia bacterium]
MTKWERVQAALRGDIVDRVPVSLWGHDFAREWSAEELAEAMLERHRKFDWDFMKVNPRACSFVEDWGCRFQRPADHFTSPTLLECVVNGLQDWGAIRPVDPRKGTFGQQLQTLRLIRDGLADEAPFAQTVFSPLSVAGRLAGGQEDLVKETMARDPQTLHRALSVVTETLVGYTRASLEMGASGIFFATTVWASKTNLSEDQYREFGMPYDLQVLEAARGAPFNVLHICGHNIFFDLLAGYPAHAVNWASTLPGNPTLAEGLSRTKLAVIGGISEKTTLTEGSPEDVAAEAKAAQTQTGGRRFLLGPGCTIPPQSPEANLWAVRQSAEAPARTSQ